MISLDLSFQDPIFFVDYLVLKPLDLSLEIIFLDRVRNILFFVLKLYFSEVIELIVYEIILAALFLFHVFVILFELFTDHLLFLFKLFIVFRISLVFVWLELFFINFLAIQSYIFLSIISFLISKLIDLLKLSIILIILACLLFEVLFFILSFLYIHGILLLSLAPIIVILILLKSFFINNNLW